MDLFDFFYPEQAQAAHLRKIAAAQRMALSSSSSTSRQGNEIAALKSDVHFLTLVLATLLKRLAETQTMSLADVRDLLDEVDGMDGMANGGLEPGVLRGLLGLLKQDAEAKADAESEAFQEIAELHRRYRRQA